LAQEREMDVQENGPESELLMWEFSLRIVFYLGPIDFMLLAFCPKVEDLFLVAIDDVEDMLCKFGTVNMIARNDRRKRISCQKFRSQLGEDAVGAKKCPPPQIGVRSSLADRLHEKWRNKSIYSRN
jgi:hypothetical protein